MSVSNLILEERSALVDSKISAGTTRYSDDRIKKGGSVDHTIESFFVNAPPEVKEEDKRETRRSKDREADAGHASINVNCIHEVTRHFAHGISHLNIKRSNSIIGIYDRKASAV
uniref:Uncharacterized protein n=1 Tax=Vespula pensylvanica TaxID=30213 RepID=A0A834UGQ1_VESPE|nr:hypothetical protein H0235_001086 [Vespula pensylvanica]